MKPLLPGLGRKEITIQVDGQEKSADFHQLDAVELYLEAARDCMHPDLIGYLTMLLTICGPSEDDVGVGHRTYGQPRPNRRVTTMDNVGIRGVLVNEWIDSFMLAHLAFVQDTEKDSKGNMPTRADSFCFTR